MKKIFFILLLCITLILPISAMADRNISRQEFIRMINSSLSISSDANPTFIDVPTDSQYFNDIKMAVGYGYILGDGTGRINPTKPLTRAEAAVMLGRIIGTDQVTHTSFKDDNLIPDWAKSSVKSLTDLKIIAGHQDSTYRPRDYLTVSQCETIIARVKENLYGGGSGSVDSPYRISSFFHLRNISLNPDKYFIITKDINLLNSNYIYYPVKRFSGTLDGNGFKIIGLTSSSSLKGIFKTIEKAGKISNIKLSTPTEYISFASENNGLIENCANISGNRKNTFSLNYEHAGNIANINTGTIKNCYNTSLITHSNGYASGICGVNSGTIINCFNTGTSSEKRASGICALNYSTIKNCFSTGYLSGDNSFAISWKESGVKPQDCYYSSKMFSPGEKKITENDLISIFISLDDFELTEGNNFPTLKSNPFYNNENYTEFAGGDGSRINPFLVSEKNHIENISKYLSAHFRQTNNISLSTIKKFSAIGSKNTPFTGSFDGNGYEISDLLLYSPLQDNISFFGYTTGEIKNVHLKNFFMSGNKNIASLATQNDGIIENCSTDAYINASVGAGLILTNNGLVNQCTFYGYIKGTTSAGALVYTNNNKIENSFAGGSVLAPKSSGISFVNNSTISACCSFASLSGNNTGLLAIDNQGDISKSYYLSDCNAVGSTIRSIEAFPRKKVQAEHDTAYNLLDPDIWRFNIIDYPDLVANPKPPYMVENTTDFAGGDGSFQNPFKVVTPLHLSNISKYPSSSFVLMNNINLSQLSEKKGFVQTEIFSGFFDGNGYSISNLNQQGISSLFGTNYGIISNLTTDNFTLYGELTAPICITNNGNITLCRNNSSLDGKNVSGIAVINNSSIDRCINNGDLKGELTGGISSSNTGEISDCLVSADVIGKNSTSEIFGITSGGEVLSSIVTGDLYFEDGIGKFYPISDAPYNFCYYLDRYNEKYNGKINFTQLITKKDLKGINFSDIWINQEGEFPYINNISKDGLKTPESFKSGDGSKEKPYVILTLNDLYNIRMYPDAHYTILSDIVWGSITSKGIVNNGGKGFAPIENFTGTLDGKNSIIYGIEILYSAMDDSGLFSQNNGSIKNLGFSGIRVEGNINAGAVCGKNYGYIDNVKVMASRIGSASGNAGGICGENHHSISFCTNDSDVFAASSSGGITGINHKNVLNSSNYGGIITVTDNSPAYSGGIAGKNLMIIEKCINTGRVYSYSDKKSAYSGGITGFLTGSVNTSYNTGDHTAKSSVMALAGGIAGSGDKFRISYTYNIGYGLTSSPTSYTGSIVGAGTGSVTSSYYDHTLNLPCGGESINELSVFGITSDDFASLDNLTQFSKDTWEIPNGSNFPYPQIINNPHKSKTYSDNVRDFGGGDGSISNPYRILTAEHLDNVRLYLGSSFALMGNIDMRKYLQSHEFAPIGDNIFGFFGTFSGGGYEIIGLKTTGDAFGGLFRQNHGEIYDLKISGGSLNGDTAGAICALNNGLIYRCSATMDTDISSDKHLSIGGIAGINQASGMIVSCSNKSAISGSAHSVTAGGLTALNNGVIAGSINYSDISISGVSLAIAGGVAGTNAGTISDSANISNITTMANPGTETFAGGVAGTNSGTLVNCYSSASSVSGKAYGGITANNIKNVVNCYYNNEVNKPSTLGECSAFAVSKDDMANPDTFENFDFSEMWFATGSHLPVPFETLY